MASAYTPYRHNLRFLRIADLAVLGRNISNNQCVILIDGLISKCQYLSIRSIPTELVVTIVLPGGQAEKLGFQVGDVVTYYAGERLHGDFLAFIKRREVEPADSLAHELRLRRQGRELQFEVKPGKLGLGLQDRGLSVMTAKLGRADGAKQHRQHPRRKLVARHRAARAAHSRSP
jgi:hypothetical protein